jgi:hypothetical protein
VVKNAGWHFEKLPLNEDGTVKEKSDSGEPVPEVLQMRGYTCVHKQSEQFTASAEAAAAAATAAATSAADKSDSSSGDAPAAATAGDSGTAATTDTAAKADATAAAETTTTATTGATTAAAEAAAPAAAASKVVTVDRPHAAEDKDPKVASAYAGCGAACIIA